METKNGYMKTKFAIIDIDGVLSEYPNKIFYDFVYNKIGKRFNSLEEVINSIGRIKYSELKLEFRLSGLKKKYKLRTESLEVINFLKKNDYVITLITSRPNIYKNIKYTREWLNDNKVNYDHLFFTKSKGAVYLDIENYNNVIVIDDEYKGLEEYIGNKNVKLFKFGMHNKLYTNIYHINNWFDIYKYL